MNDDMNHMRYIDSVRQMDIKTLRNKESTYQGSWKRAGGKSSWFMLRRNMDRLLTMMKPPPMVHGFSIADLDDCIESAKAGGNGDATVDYSIMEYLRDSYVAEDIFAKIEEHPKGQDGTVLACVRDLRCYLTLVEAEMMSRGFVTCDSPIVELDPPPPVSNEISAKEIFIAYLAGHGGVSNQTAELWWDKNKLNVERDLSDVGPLKKVYNTETTAQIGSAEIATKPYNQMTTLELKNEYDRLEKANKESKSWGAAVGARIEFMREIQAEFDRRLAEPGTPEDGGHHASLYPWQTTWKKFNDMPIECAHFYKQVTKDVFRLEAVVNTTKLPKFLLGCYRPHGNSGWVLKIENLPEELRDCYPRLQREMNQIEYDQSDEQFRHMYDKSNSSDNKWIIDPRFEAWAQQV